MADTQRGSLQEAAFELSADVRCGGWSLVCFGRLTVEYLEH